MAKTSEKMERWSFLDHLLSKGQPVSQYEIFEAYQNNPKLQLIQPSKFGRYSKDEKEKELSRNYRPSLRKDLTVFKTALKENNLSEMLVEIKGGVKKKVTKDGMDYRTRMYCYKDSSFSIIPLLSREMSDGEYRSMVKAIEKIRSFLNEQTFQEIRFAMQSLIEADYDKGVKCVDYEDNRRLKGREFRPYLYNAIREKQVVRVNYRKFNGEEYEFEFHPYLLKQYNERWFVFGLNPTTNNPYWNVPLDRIVKISTINECCYQDRPQKYDSYFDNIVGVTKSENQKPEEILIGIHDQDAWGRITTKPLQTQTTRKEFDPTTSYGQVMLNVIPNKELYSKILSWGQHVEIESPASVRESLQNLLASIQHMYHPE